LKVNPRQDWANVWAKTSGRIKSFSKNAISSIKTVSMPTRLVALAVLILLFVWLWGAIALSEIDSESDFTPRPEDSPEGGSATVAMAAGLLEREIKDHGWTPGMPWFYWSFLIDNMPAYQLGIRTTISQYVLELRDHQGRNRGLGSVNSDLAKAYEAISYPPDRWHVGLSIPFIYPSSAGTYRDAVESLRRYNRQVSENKALYVRSRADALAAVIDRLALSLGNASSVLESHVATRSSMVVDSKSDNVYYNVKGQAYAALLLLSSLREDEAELIKARGLEKLWMAMLLDLRGLSDLDPLIVSNGRPGALLIQNHLSEQGFILLRARNHMREVTSILQK